MATIVVEDGSIVEDANSYCSVLDLQTYCSDRNITLEGDESSLLIQAMDYIEQLDFIGYRATDEQELEWPRKNVVIDCREFPDNEIPKQLKLGQMATAVAIDQGNSPLNVITSAVKREKVDVLEVEYASNAISNPIDPNINNYLKKLLNIGNNGYQFKVSKA